jgi:HSP20 family protein
MTLFDQFDSLFDITRNGLLSGSYMGRAFVPPTDLVVTDDAVTVVMDVPGLKAENLEIELNDNMLTVRGERTRTHAADGDHSWYRFERGYGKFQRVLQVPKGLDPNAITASLDDGVLTLILPQPESLKPHRISINSTNAPAIEASEQKELVGATA